jgi:Uncharacterised nucleotidyltransferase
MSVTVDMGGIIHKTSARPSMVEKTEIRDEFHLLLLCARTRVGPQQRDLIQSLALKQLDWDFILAKAHPHALIPLLYRNMSELCPDRVPPAVLQQLESDYKVISERNRANTEEMIKVLRSMESAGIRAVPYKGPALAVLAHGDITLRKFWDLDIVIRPRDIIAAKALLISHGYQWHPFQGQVTGRNEARNFRLWHEYNFVHPDTNAIIDLHWRIAPRRFPFNVDLDDLWKHLVPVRLLDEEIWTFPPEVLLLLLCVHGSKDLWWRRIGWTCDVAELLASNPDLDWSYCLELATHTGARRMLLLGLALAHELLQAPLPGQVCTSIRSDDTVQSLVEHMSHRLFDEQTIHNRTLESLRFRIRVRERLHDRIPVYRHLVKALFVMAFVPNVRDRELVKLPAALSLLYYLVHPARLAHKMWSHAIRRSNTTP